MKKLRRSKIAGVYVYSKVKAYYFTAAIAAS